ncbi:hypothetical protein QA601_08855 [Chitinispirillales bacterium ANBcel5]|uniref:hypothetical protein n=1 Tax=Cellulosispirillum alkaliphilum TaxID=3039283 RepID=UPI002A53B8E5|nr:hypothetical protein [Chitinispirillales bacterium ANBcel5]
MSTVFLMEKECFLCGGKNKQYESGPLSHLSGARDLDGRPSGFQRSGIYNSIHRCIFCGYCSPDLTMGVSGFSELIQMSPYRKQLNNPLFPETANSFLCYTMLVLSAGQIAEAGWTTLHGAWICDDNGFDESADYCRNKALNLFIKCRDQKESFADSYHEEQLILTDILRRLRRFEEAQSLCDKQLLSCISEDASVLFHFEKMLISETNCKCYSIQDAFEYQETLQ